MKIYRLYFKDLTGYTTVIGCIGKNKKEALNNAKQSCKAFGMNPDWLKINMIKAA